MIRQIASGRPFMTGISMVGDKRNIVKRSGFTQKRKGCLNDLKARDVAFSIINANGTT